jgi:hypothetical protein
VKPEITAVEVVSTIAFKKCRCLEQCE